MAEILALAPACKDYVWGGENLQTRWGKNSSLSPLAECWELSFHPDGLCMVASGPQAGKTLCEVVTAQDIGKNAAKFPFFPVLIKFLDAKQNLSVQVHPSDEYALQNENSFGKTEAWYILDAVDGAGIYCGFRRQMTKVEVETAIQNGTLTDYLQFIPVKKGETYFIPSGTVHAIGAGITLCEIQQNSNLTYRVYDYGRLGADGKPRALHVEKALSVMDFSPYRNPLFESKEEDKLLCRCAYFSAYEVDARVTRKFQTNGDSFHAITVVDGDGWIGELPAKKGQTFFVPAGYGEYCVSGIKYILVRV